MSKKKKSISREFLLDWRYTAYCVMTNDKSLTWLTIVMWCACIWLCLMNEVSIFYSCTYIRRYLFYNRLLHLCCSSIDVILDLFDQTVKMRYMSMMNSAQAHIHYITNVYMYTYLQAMHTCETTNTWIHATVNIFSAYCIVTNPAEPVAITQYRWRYVLPEFESKRPTSQYRWKNNLFEKHIKRHFFLQHSIVWYRKNIGMNNRSCASCVFFFLRIIHSVYLHCTIVFFFFSWMNRIWKKVFF